MLVNVFKLFDLGLMILAFMIAGLAVFHRGGVTMTEFFSMRVKVQNFAIFSLFVLVWHLIFGFSDSTCLAGFTSVVVRSLTS